MSSGEYPCVQIKDMYSDFRSNFLLIFCSCTWCFFSDESLLNVDTCHCPVRGNDALPFKTPQSENIPPIQGCSSCNSLPLPRSVYSAQNNWDTKIAGLGLTQWQKRSFPFVSIETGAQHQWASEEVAYANEGQMCTDRDLEEHSIKEGTSQHVVISLWSSWGQGVDNSVPLFGRSFVTHFTRGLAAL